VLLRHSAKIEHNGVEMWVVFELARSGWVRGIPLTLVFRAIRLNLRKTDEKFFSATHWHKIPVLHSILLDPSIAVDLTN